MDKVERDVLAEVSFEVVDRISEGFLPAQGLTDLLFDQTRLQCILQSEVIEVRRGACASYVLGAESNQGAGKMQELAVIVR